MSQCESKGQPCSLLTALVSPGNNAGLVARLVDWEESWEAGYCSKLGFPSLAASQITLQTVFFQRYHLVRVRSSNCFFVHFVPGRNSLCATRKDVDCCPMLRRSHQAISSNIKQYQADVANLSHFISIICL